MYSVIGTVRIYLFLPSRRYPRLWRSIVRCLILDNDMVCPRDPVQRDVVLPSAQNALLALEIIPRDAVFDLDRRHRCPLVAATAPVAPAPWLTATLALHQARALHICRTLPG